MVDLVRRRHLDQGGELHDQVARVGVVLSAVCFKLVKLRFVLLALELVFYCRHGSIAGSDAAATRSWDGANVAAQWLRASSGLAPQWPRGPCF